MNTLNEHTDAHNGSSAKNQPPVEGANQAKGHEADTGSMARKEQVFGDEF